MHFGFEICKDDPLSDVKCLDDEQLKAWFEANTFETELFYPKKRISYMERTSYIKQTLGEIEGEIKLFERKKINSTIRPYEATFENSFFNPFRKEFAEVYEYWDFQSTEETGVEDLSPEEMRETSFSHTIELDSEK